MVFVNIDAPGNRHNRIGVKAIQRNHGAAERKAAAEARRNARRAKRASPDAILFYPWPIGGVATNDTEGAYVQGPNDTGHYQVAVVGKPKGEPQLYCDAVSTWVKKPLRIWKSEPMIPPDVMSDEQRAGFARGFLSIVLEPDQS